MNTQHGTRVAVLLATHNGSRYVDAQIKSLAENVTQFTLHWLDDHSTDNTRELVRSSASKVGIDLREWHQAQRQGVPGAFFQLLECVEADIYLFCDQDDIWEPGKIDVTVANLLPHKSSPAHCYSEPMAFNNDKPEILFPSSKLLGIDAVLTTQESRAFTSTMAIGNTSGFTRPLRDIYLSHKDIARKHAFMHDWWMYIIALASGTSRMLSGVPTTLYRRHATNVSGQFVEGRGTRRIVLTWRSQQTLRQVVSRQAEGFILASPTLPPGAKLERLLALARLLAKVDRRQSAGMFYRLIRRRAMPASSSYVFWYAATCLSSHAPS